MEIVRLLIAVPTMGDIHTELVGRLLYWAKKLEIDHIEFYFTFRVTPHDRARNQIVTHFLKTSCTHLLMIDSDTVPPTNAPAKLLSHDVDFVSAMTPILRFNHEDKDWETIDNCFVATDRNAKSEPITKIPKRNTGLWNIRRCGASCLLVKRHVFEKLKTPYFKFVTNDENTEHRISEDIYFCDQVGDSGFEMFADSDVICHHYKDIML